MIRLVVDSTFGITKEYAEQNKIEVVGLKVLFGEDVYNVGFQDTWVDIYERMRTDKLFPTTSQPSPQDFIDAINKIYSEDETAEIIILTISSALSGTINAATIAKNNFEGKQIEVIDSMNASICCRMLTEEIVEHINKGISYKDLLELIPTIQKSLKIQFVPDNMDSLKRGGRINAVAATFASILKIKPVFKFEMGKIHVTKKVLGLGKAITEMISALPKQMKKLYVCYIHDTTNVKTILDKISSMLKLNNVETLSVDPVFGTHVGIGSIGIASLEEY